MDGDGLKVIARFRFLRGTPFDPFGRTRDRRLERELITQYETTIQDISETLNTENHRLAVELASYPESIRGYGHVKREHIETTEVQIAALLEALRDDSPKSHAA